ncbi:phenazine biosynthesis protein PhzF [Micromonospora globispora]|uniref:Phenazine biosynthesis protein PhzF n=1 Tax=Micromonospora globispora TaxID=1450148 RepID=A0A317KBG3_9ACTN|nr:PhzF family phenazine biosynthesis isomerase [Micromonospora globispora]PWU50729.1 phenazine biosynthesis protein PhzF [Micromonospora globispora]RQW82675.1 phenazine biosynthesis protein PhzF [Micromonospora globispora]
MEILRYAAFSADPAGGNPAGVVLDATGVSDAEMLRVAADIGYSETAFLVPHGNGRFEVRYFSPLAEVPFCGHATIASAAAYAQRHGPGVLHFDTRAGLVEVSTDVTPDGTITATLISVQPQTKPIAASDLAALLEALGWAPGDLDATLPPRVAFAGAWHPVVAAANRQRLADLDYDMNALATLMAQRDWTTIDLVWRESSQVFHSRNPFPPGGVVEDPATGAAAAAFGGYLRELGLVAPPVTVTMHQGQDLGRPSVLTIGIPAEPRTGIAVTGTAVALAA